MSTTTNGKAKRFALNTKQNGVEVRVGDGSVPRITLTKSDLADASNLLGCYFSTSGESVLDFINRARAAERERDEANKSLHSTISERDQARADQREANERGMHWAGLAGKAERERDQARADHAAADVALQETLDDLKRAERKLVAEKSAAERLVREAHLERDAAIVDRDTWKQNAESDAAELIALAEKLNLERQKVRDIENLRSEALTERDATILGWRLATVAVVFVAIALAVWKGGAR